jgi:hypothetical protein
MKNILFVLAAFAVLSFASCYVRVRESHPHPRTRVIIQASDNTVPKDSLQSPASDNINKKDSLQSPVNSEPVKK